ncbi:PP2C family serine/threonine-protein phosphatase [Intestinibacter sp.]|uniref:PP2C family serine/threonine-protein phosphatase n=1 Tax=Intestinibacter sp. TaxID=1965304 RepID=UPI003F13D59D
MNIFKASVTGYKNLEKSFGSQDFSIYKKYENYIFCAVADGHSSSRFKYSHIGSRLACEAALNVINSYLYDKKIDLFIDGFKSRKILFEIKSKWRNMVYQDFYKKNYKAYKLDYIQYGTTLTFAILLEKNIVFFNLGDSGILIKKDGPYESVFENNNYKIVNSLAEDRCEEKMQYKIIEIYGELKIVIFTDGFINSFYNYEELESELDKTFEMLNKNVFTCMRLKKTYSRCLQKLSKYGSLDDISVIFIYN